MALILWMRVGVLALLVFVILKDLTRAHLRMLREKNLDEDEKESLRELTKMVVLVGMGVPHRGWF